MAMTEDEGTLQEQTVASLADGEEGQVLPLVQKRRRIITTRFLLDNGEFLSLENITELAQELTTLDDIITTILDTAECLTDEEVEGLSKGKMKIINIRKRLARDAKHKEERLKKLQEHVTHFEGIPVRAAEPGEPGHVAITQGDINSMQPGTSPGPEPDAAPDAAPEN